MKKELAIVLSLALLACIGLAADNGIEAAREALNRLIKE